MGVRSPPSRHSGTSRPLPNPVSSATDRLNYAAVRDAPATETYATPPLATFPVRRRAGGGWPTESGPLLAAPADRLDTSLRGQQWNAAPARHACGPPPGRRVP